MVLQLIVYKVHQYILFLFQRVVQRVAEARLVVAQRREDGKLGLAQEREIQEDWKAMKEKG